MYKPTKLSVLIGGICALILTMGIGRYAFTPMIPYMQEQLGMSESLAGWLAGWGYIGYLTGLFIVWLVNDIRLKDYLYRYGLFLSVGATLVMSLHDHTLIWYLSRFFAGVATAFGFMFGTGLVHEWIIYHKKREELGIHFAGMGLGIVVGALVVMLTSLHGFFPLEWRYQWVVLAMTSAVLLVPAFLLIPRPVEAQIQASKVKQTQGVPSETWLWLLQAAYICAGFSNTMNVTFTSLMAEYQPLKGQGAFMWLYVGLAAAPAPFIWDRMARLIGYLDALRIAFVISILSNLLVAWSDSFAMTLASALTFGFSFVGIVSLTLTLVGNHYRYRGTQVMARLTLSYCLAQIISPILAGTLVEHVGSFTLSIYIVCAIMVVGLAALLLMKKHKVPS